MLSAEDTIQIKKLIESTKTEILHEVKRRGTGAKSSSSIGDDYGRLLNQTKAFEGGGLLPQPLRGQRIPTVNNLKVIRNKSVLGGAQVTLGWLDENLGDLDKIEVQVWAASDFGNFLASNNIKDIDFSTLVRYSAPVVFKSAPGELFIPATQSMVVVLTAATVHSSGVVSLDSFQSSAAIVVEPLGSAMDYRSASFTITSYTPTVYIIDTSGGAVTATLPPVASVPNGLPLNFKKITTDANAMTISGPENIDGAASLSTTIGYVNYVIIADRTNNQWWLVR